MINILKMAPDTKIWMVADRPKKDLLGDALVPLWCKCPVELAIRKWVKESRRWLAGPRR